MEQQEDTNIKNSASFGLASKVKDYFQLIKFTLSFMVVFSTVVSYLLAPNIRFDLLQVLLLFIGGMLITGSANTINQILEKDTDALMKRTATRPLPSGRMTVTEASIFAVIAGGLGGFIMWWFFNFSSAMVGLFSLFLYGFVYTPLKKVNSVSVLVGAIPGALPCLIGWVAATDSFSAGGWILFAIQFLWQFPHFWAIAWVLDDDYKKAGFKMLPSGKRDRDSARQALLYTISLLPLSVMPYIFGITSWLAVVLMAAVSIYFLFLAYRLYDRCDVLSARKLMFGSFVYLPIVQIALVIDKV